MLARKPHRIASKRLVAKRKPKIPKSLLKKVDTAYSLKIRARDKHCQYPGCLKRTTQNSHYHGRAIKNTRFDDDNCIALCYYHHFGSRLLGFEYQKQTKKEHGHDGQYTIFMRRRLGTRRFNALGRRASSQKKLILTKEFLQNKLTELQNHTSPQPSQKV